MLQICLEEDVCLYHPNALWGEFECPKTLQGSQLENCIDSWFLGSESLKKYQTAPTSPHVVWEGFKKNSPHSSKNKLQHIQLSDTTGTSNGTGFYGQMKLEKKSLLAANPPDGFGANRDKKYPMLTVKYTAGPIMLWPIFLPEVLEVLFRCMASWILSNTNR